MSWRQTAVDTGPQSAKPLGNHRQRPLPSISKNQHRRPTPVSHRVPSSVSTSLGNVEEARKLYHENVERASVASRRQQDRYDANRHARLRRDEDDRVRKQCLIDAQRRAAQPRERKCESSRPRTVQSTHTACQSRTLSVGSKWSHLDHPQPLLVWSEGFPLVTHRRETLVERALREGCPEPNEADESMIKDAIRDGLAIRSDANGARFFTNGLDPDPWTKATNWKKLVSDLKIAEDGEFRVEVVSDGGKGCSKIGQGTFNIVLSYPPCYAASYMPENLVWRVTRPDQDNTGNYRYQNTSTTEGEIKNALFASSNRIGVAVYGVAAFEAIRSGRTMRHGIVMAMERAECDLVRFLDSMRTEAQGSKAAEQMVELLFRASRMGVAFTDIKPGNVLVFKDQDGGVFYRLTDYDPAFFIMTDKDWQSLLLLNLAFLSAHVYSADFGAVGIGWAKAVSPLLRQLVHNRWMYNSDWLFSARGFAVDFKEPVDASDFELQKNVTSMWYSYFVKRCNKGGRASRFKWSSTMADNKRELDEHWKEPSNRRSWPTGWDRHDRNPLVKQIVDFALESC